MFGTWATIAAAMAVGLVLVVARALRESLVAVLGVLVIAGIGYVLARGDGARTLVSRIARERLRTQLRIGRGRVRIAAPGSPPLDVALEDVHDCVVAEGSELLADARVRTYVLALRLRDGRRQHVPLFVADAAEAQFVMNRINEVLAVEGRDTSHGYRGQAHT